MSERRRNRLWSWVFVAVVALMGLWTPGALAQDIPDAIRMKTTPLDAAEAKVVADYVAAHSKNLGDDADPQLLKKDRAALLVPLEKTDTSVPFRIVYSGELVPIITKMVGSAKELIVVNGLILAGDLATDGALELVRKQVGAKAPAVRYQAGYALERTFQAVHDSQPAILPAKLKVALDDVSDRIGKEKDAKVLDMFVRAGLAGMKIDGLVNDGISAVAKGTIQGAKGAKNPGDVKEAEALLRAADGVQLTIGQMVGQNVVSGPAAQEAAEMAGVLIVRVSRMVEKKELPLDANDPLRVTCAQVVSASQKLIQFSGQTLQPGGSFVLVDATGAQIDLGKDVKAGTTKGDAQFSTDVDAVRAMLTKAPFNIAPEKLK